MSGTAGAGPRTWLCVVCALIERDGSLLLVRQRGEHDPTDLWSLPGGVVEAGESLEAALRREVAEETGLRIAELTRLLWTVESRSTNLSALTFFFAVDCDDRADPVHADPDRIVREAAWVPREQALNLLAAVPHRRMREPLLAVLSGAAPEGSMWTYATDHQGEDVLVQRLPL